MALVHSVQHFRVFLYGRRFLVSTDHSALQWLQSFQEPRGQVARWIERLAEYDYEILHRTGLKHKNADALSRYPLNAIAQEVWLPAYPKGELKKAQQADEGVQELLLWLRSATRPAPQQLEGKPFDTRYYRSRFDELVLVEGILYINSYGENGDITGTRLVVPRAMRPEVLRACHDEPACGHLGVAKTLNKLIARLHWLKMKRQWRIGVARAKCVPNGTATESVPRWDPSRWVVPLSGLGWT